jgi:NAD(P)-dependent dehydrogenase (short-subunit alcohol dehydrogenase family)
VLTGPGAARRVVVTGGSSGIGAAAVGALAAAGAHVSSWGRDEERGRRVAEQASAAGRGRVAFTRCDVRDREAVRASFAAAAAELGGIDALVHLAGIRTEGPAEELTDEAWNELMDVNARGTFVVNQEVFPYLREGGGGRILNFASGAALYPYVGAAHYSASKAAVISWTRTVAHEWGRYGITANAINPAMWTPIYEAKRAHLSREALAAHDAAMLDRIPMGGKLGDPARDLAPVLVFLLSEGAQFITGQIVSVDGGMVPLR